MIKSFCRDSMLDMQEESCLGCVAPGIDKKTVIDSLSVVPVVQKITINCALNRLKDWPLPKAL